MLSQKILNLHDSKYFLNETSSRLKTKFHIPNLLKRNVALIYFTRDHDKSLLSSKKSNFAWMVTRMTYRIHVTQFFSDFCKWDIHTWPITITEQNHEILCENTKKSFFLENKDPISIAFHHCKSFDGTPSFSIRGKKQIF